MQLTQLYNKVPTVSSTTNVWRSPHSYGIHSGPLVVYYSYWGKAYRLLTWFWLKLRLGGSPSPLTFHLVLSYHCLESGNGKNYPPNVRDNVVHNNRIFLCKHDNCRGAVYSLLLIMDCPSVTESSVLTDVVSPSHTSRKNGGSDSVSIKNSFPCSVVSLTRGWMVSWKCGTRSVLQYLNRCVFNFLPKRCVFF